MCGEGCEHRKQWIENRLQELAGIFALDVAGYAVLDNHMHVVLKLNDNVAADWSDEDAARRCCSSVGEAVSTAWQESPTTGRRIVLARAD